MPQAVAGAHEHHRAQELTSLPQAVAGAHELQGAPELLNLLEEVISMMGECNVALRVRIENRAVVL